VTGPRVEVLPRGRGLIYLRRAENLLKAMDQADRDSNPDGVGVNAIQAAVALADAYTVSMLQRRSRGQDHSEVLLLIRDCPDDTAPAVAQLLQRILNRRTEVLYASREVTLRQSRELAVLARKLHSAVLPAIARTS
jgi:hypothetical protein